MLGVAGVAALVLGVVWLLNWGGVTLLTGALGLRRVRWGTPGGRAAVWASVLTGAAGVGLVGGYFLLAAWLGPNPSDVAIWLSVAGTVAVLALWTAGNLAFAGALLAAWGAEVRPGEPPERGTR